MAAGARGRGAGRGRERQHSAALRRAGRRHGSTLELQRTFAKFEVSLAAVARRLVEAGAELEAANHELDRPLHLAASVGNLEVSIIVYLANTE